VLQPERVNAPDSLAAINNLEPDAIVIAAYGQILKQPLLDIPRRGCLNVHASLLPKHRGASPVAAAILSGDEETGADIVRKAVTEPLRWIATNAGKDGSVIIDAVRKSPKGVGYDAEGDEFGNMVAKGIIDPTKVVRTGLENAASIAVMVLVTEALVADIPEKEKTPAMPGGGGGMGGMDYGM